MQSIVIVGGGFAGVWAALAAAELRRTSSCRGRNFSIRLVSRDPWLTIRPRLYESSLEGVRVPLDDVLAPVGVELVRGEVTRIDPARQAIIVADVAGEQTLSYDRLVLAAGSRLHRPQIPGIEYAFGVDTYAEAIGLEQHLSTSDARSSAVVVGAGFTGIEVATALASRRRVTVVDRAPVIAPDLGSAARSHVEAAFATLGIDARLGAGVAAVSPDGVTLDNGEQLPAGTTVWTGGFRASDLAGHFGVDRDEIGRVSVDEYLRISGVPSAYAAGDVARAIADSGDDWHVAPMSCQCAIPMGAVAGRNAAADLLGLRREPFTHSEYVTCLDLGDAGALFMEGWSRKPRLTGFWAKTMKRAINTRLIYPPRAVAASALTSAA
jgi:NADH dehydrogenase